MSDETVIDIPDSEEELLEEAVEKALDGDEDDSTDSLQLETRRTPPIIICGDEQLILEFLGFA